MKETPNETNALILSIKEARDQNSIVASDVSIKEGCPNPIDRVVFSISLLTLLVTIVISGYKDFLSNKFVLIFFHPVSLFDLLILMSFFLFLSVYVSAIYNLKFSKIKTTKSNLFDSLSFIADLFYFIGILMIPVFIVAIYLLSICTYCIINAFNNIFIPALNSHHLHTSTISILNTIALLIPILISFASILIALLITLKVLSFTHTQMSEILDCSMHLIIVTLKWTFIFSVFIITMFVYCFFFTNSMCLDLHTNNHEFEIDLSNITIIQGTYVETGTVYLMKPNLPFPVALQLSIPKTDDTHISLIGLKFVNPQFDKKIMQNITHRPTQKRVITFVPDRG